MAFVAAIGLRLHSGWAASVLVAQDSAKAPALIARRRIALCEPRAKQPYHAAESMELREAEAFITACRITTIALAVEALERLGAETGGLEFDGARLA
ncbi:MAG TPA: hypothetical protein VII48_09490, partial [Rhizomicrobium sp.]